MLDSLQRMLEVQRLVLQGFHAVDHGQRIDEPAITEDFALTLGDHTLTAETYRTFLASRADAEYVTRHMVSNFQVLDETDEGLTVAFSAAVYRRNAPDEPSSVVVSDFVDVWVQTGEQWLQRSRTIEPVLTVEPGGE